MWDSWVTDLDRQPDSSQISRLSPQWPPLPRPRSVSFSKGAGKLARGCVTFCHNFGKKNQTKTKKEKWREANSKSLHIYWRGSEVNPKKIKVPGEVLKMAVGLKRGNTDVEEGEGPTWTSTERLKVSVFMEQQLNKKLQESVAFTRENTCRHLLLTRTHISSLSSVTISYVCQRRREVD